MNNTWNSANLPVRVGILGAGAWGNNIVRNIAECERTELAAVCDLDEGVRRTLSAKHARAHVTGDYDELLALPGLEAVIIATPAARHFEHACKALQAGLHVLVEKPICTCSREAALLCRMADESGLTLMTGHTMLYHTVVHDVRRRISEGELGDIRYLYLRRLNLGRVRPDVDALWNLAPHDITMACFLLDAWPVAVNARGWSYLQPDRGIADVCFFQMEFPGGVAVNGHVSWLDPLKDRTVVVVGSEKMLVYDDLHPSHTLQIYDKRVEVEFQSPMTQFADYSTRVRAGDLVIPTVPRCEPLAEEIRHFAACIRNGTKPLTDGWQGLRLVRVMEAMSASMRGSGKLEEVAYGSGTGSSGRACPRPTADERNALVAHTAG